MRRLASVLAACLLLLGLLVPSAAADHTGLDFEPLLAADDPDRSFEPLPDGAGGALSVVDEGILGTTPGPDDHAWKYEYPVAWDDPEFAGPKVLIVYAHGVVGPVDPATGEPTPLVAQPPPARPLLVGNGLAWAASSYSHNGYVIDEAVDETHAMIELFTTETGMTPDAVIILGVSMGGHVTGVAIERYPASFAGAMPICGVLGDQALFNYYGDVNLVAQALAGITPDGKAIPADYLSPGDENTPPGTGLQLIRALGLGEGFTGRGHVLGSVVEQLSGGERPLAEQAWAFWNSDATDVGPFPFLIGVIGGAISGGPDNRPIPVYDNTQRLYQVDAEVGVSGFEQRLNERVARFPADDGAEPPHPVITGDIGGATATKVLTLHGIGDLFVPFSMEQEYARRVRAMGNGDLLVQRAIRGLGHCTFSPEELGTALTDLLTWVGGGPTPEGDDVLDGEAVAARDFGCRFTIDGATPPADRQLVPSCADARRPGADRVRGPNRRATAIAAALASRAAPDTVVIATEDDFADALAAAVLAGALGAPVVLTDGAALAEAVADYLADTTPGTPAATVPGRVVLVGGEAALSPQVLADVEAIVGAGNVERISGPTRYATAAAIAGSVQSDEVFVARGDDFADAVAASALAAFAGIPLLLTRPGALPDATAQQLRDGGYTTVHVLGGESAVSSTVFAEIEAIVADTRRISGPNRYATSAQLVLLSIERGMSAGAPWLATGQAFPDALTAGPAAAAQGVVLGLVHGSDPARGDAVIGALVATRRVERVVVAGGTAAVAQDVVDRVTARLDRSAM